MPKAKTVEFYNLSTQDYIQVPTKDCKVETITTKRGKRTRVVAYVDDRKLSKFVAKDFKL